MNQTRETSNRDGNPAFPAFLPALIGGIGGWVLGALSFEMIRANDWSWAFSLTVALLGGLSAWALPRFQSGTSSGAFSRTDSDETPDAAQVAHDLRSPLAALEMLAAQLGQIPEEKRALLRSSTARIRDIANGLVKDEGASQSPESEPAVLLLASVLDSLVSEKRLEFRSRIGLEIDFRLLGESYGLFARLDPRGLKRVVSSLIDLSADSISKSRRDGRIELRLRPKAQDPSGSRVLVQLRDNGDQSIPDAALDSIRTIAKKWGAEISLVSQRDGQGSTITLELPKEKAPGWFVPRVEFPQNGKIVIADDDASVHQMWEGRFRSASNDRAGGTPALLHVSSAQELRNLAASPDAQRADLLLIDYEFLGEQATGLDVIEDLGLAARSILVTSRFEEPRLRERCERLGVKLLPKSMAGFVPLGSRNRVVVTRAAGRPAAAASATATAPAPSLAALPRIDAILIDDDDLVHMTWKIAAGREHKVLLTFRSVDDFLSIPGLARLPGDTAIFVDSNLGQGVRGELAAKALFERGFRNISLATGYAQAAHEAKPEWIRRVVGKEPVFE